MIAATEEPSVKEPMAPQIPSSAKSGPRSCSNQICGGTRSFPRFPSRANGEASDGSWSDNQVVSLISRANESEDLQYDELSFLRSFVEKSPQTGRPVLLVNLRRVIEQWLLWKSLLPCITPYYAVKCNSDPQILQTLESLGVGFDCASAGELKLMLDDFRVHPSRIIYSHPVKHVPGMTLAEARGVRLTVFDNVEELQRVSKYMPSAELLLRLKTDDSAATCPLSCKFGAAPEDWPSLLCEARRKQLRVRGVHFHVGSGCRSLGSFAAALRDARRVFDMAPSYGHHEMDLLNIGGGFPGDLSTLSVESASASMEPSHGVSFAALAAEITSEVTQLFSCPKNIRIIAEPGRFFVAACCVLATQIEGCRILDREMYEKHGNSESPSALETGMRLSAPLENERNDEGEGSVRDLLSIRSGSVACASRAIYYLNDGVYGTFNNVVYDHATVVPRVLLSSVKAIQHLQSFQRAHLSRVISNFDAPTDPEVHRLGPELAESPGFFELPLLDSVLFGPTCDGFDCILREVPLPRLNVGDWLAFEHMGAYTICAGSNFNGFEGPIKVYMEAHMDMSSVISRIFPNSNKLRCGLSLPSRCAVRDQLQASCSELKSCAGTKIPNDLGQGVSIFGGWSHGTPIGSPDHSAEATETQSGATRSDLSGMTTKIEQCKRRSTCRRTTPATPYMQPSSLRREASGIFSPQNRSSRATLLTRLPGRLEDTNTSGASVASTAGTLSLPGGPAVVSLTSQGIGFAAVRSRRGFGSSPDSPEIRHCKYFGSPRAGAPGFGSRMKRGSSFADLFSNNNNCSSQPPVLASRRTVDSKEFGTTFTRVAKIGSTTSMAPENVYCIVRRAKLCGKMDARTLATLWRTAYCNRQHRGMGGASVSNHTSNSVASVKAAA